MRAPATGCERSSFATASSAEGQDEQPSEVKSSTRIGVPPPTAGVGVGAASAMGARQWAKPTRTAAIVLIPRSPSPIRRVMAGLRTFVEVGFEDFEIRGYSRGVRRVLCCLAAAPLVLLACAKHDDEAVIDPSLLAMTEATPPIYDDGEHKIFEVHSDVKLPFRRFTDAERPKGQAPPYDRPPFHVATGSRITLRFVLTNLDTKKHNV